jgi:glycosyltransferase involved in cell wall biosynthesis
MKLCIVTPGVIRGDGQGRANVEIVLEAIRQNHEITLLASRVDREIAEHDRVHWVAITTGALPGQLLQDLVFSFKSTLWLQQHHGEFDRIQVYGAVTHFIGDVNTAQFVHSAWQRSPAHISRLRRDLYGLYHWLYTALNAHWEKRAFQRAKQVIAVSERVKQELIEIGVPAANIQVIFNGVDPQEFTPGSSHRSAFNLPEQVPLAVFAGDIRLNRKNLDTVLYALAEVPELHLAVIGDIKGSPYPALAKQLHLDSRVHFLGYRRDLPQIMQAADLFVFPSRYEPFGMVVLEAMATGLPVITAATTGAAELITPESGIVLSDPEDVSGLASALHYLTMHPIERQKMGQAARQAAEQHSWISKAKQYLDVFATK